MPSETELIKQQMSQTRASLAAKLETLETKVFSTTDVVAQTVAEVGTTVRETAQDVRAVMRETLTSMRDVLDLSQQVQHHPWMMLGASVLAGYVGGVALNNLERGTLPALPAAPEPLLPHDSEVRPHREAQPPPVRRTRSSFLQALVESFAPELDSLKRAALGMALGVVRDKINESMSPQMRGQVNEVMDRVAAKLGGDPPPRPARA